MDWFLRVYGRPSEKISEESRTCLLYTSDLYFIDGCDKLTRMKVHCYIAVSGLVWSNWCEFKRHCGVEFGAYAQRQYDYAREYSEIFFREYREVFGRDYV